MYSKEQKNVNVIELKIILNQEFEYFYTLNKYKFIKILGNQVFHSLTILNI